MDLDLFLTVDLLVDAERISTLRDILHSLEYLPVKGAEHYQFTRATTIAGASREIKIDFLAPLPLDPEQRILLKYDSRRARPRATTGFHAHVAPEACGIGEYATPIELTGGAIVHIVHPFNYIVLKLHALRDRLGDERKEVGISRGPSPASPQPRTLTIASRRHLSTDLNPSMIWRG